MRNICSKLFALLSKPSEKIQALPKEIQALPKEIQALSESHLYQVTTRRRKNSPEPRMVNNGNAEPVLVEITNLDLTDVHQRAQFQDPNGVVRDLCWDTQNGTVVILCGATGQHRRVNCENTNKQGWQLTLRDMMKLLDYSLDNFRLTNIWTDEEVDEQDLCNSTIENLTICQFELA
jgi:hypothetical protein